MRNAQGYAFLNPAPGSLNEGTDESLIDMSDAVLADSFNELVELHVDHILALKICA